MARSMRTVSFLLASLLGLVGCSTAETTRSTPGDRYARHAAQAHYTWARTLQHLLTQRLERELLDEPGQELVLELARAQTCLASRTQDPRLANQTHVLLDAYLELHEQHDSEPSSRLRRQVRRAQLDAEVAAQGVATPYFLGCEPFRTPAVRTAKGEYFQYDSKSGGPRGFRRPSMRTRARSVPGGVIK